jgi:hypothetical protein
MAGKHKAMNKVANLVPSEFFDQAGLNQAHLIPYKQFYVRSSLFPEHCHTQGIGWSHQTHHFVITCQGKANRKEAFIILYKDYRQPGEMNMAVDFAHNDADHYFSHPSATQISGNTFPVAITEKKEDPSYIYFYQIVEGDGAEYHLRRMPDVLHHQTHLGAMAYATINHTTYMIGIGYDASDIAIWKSPGVDSTGDFKLVYAGEFDSIVTGGIDREIGRYNSAWLGEAPATQEIVLFTSYGLTVEESWLDVWVIENINGPNLTMSKKVSLKISEPAKSNSTPIFMEGVTIRIDGSGLNNFHLLAAPHDYDQHTCSEEGAYLPYIYEWQFW